MQAHYKHFGIMSFFAALLMRELCLVDSIRLKLP